MLYEKEMFLTKVGDWVPREVDERIAEGLLYDPLAIQFLVGEPGYGKSVSSYRVLRKHLDSGGYGLWLPAELIRDCIAVDDALNKVLRTLDPHLTHDAGETALKLLSENSRFLMVVDDVNRVEDPTKLVRKLLIWSKPRQSESSVARNVLTSSTLIVCPMWPRLWGTVSRTVGESSWVRTVFVGLMTPEEGALAVRAAASTATREPTISEAGALATDLGNDPILIGLSAQLPSGVEPDKSSIYTEDVVERFVGTSIDEVALDTCYLAGEFRSALNQLTATMLKERKLQPSWKEVQAWLDNNAERLSLLRHLVRHGKLCRLTESQGRESFIFRHDRIRDSLLAETMSTAFANDIHVKDLLREPFYAEIVGRALVRYPQDQSFLALVSEQAPLALFEALRHFSASTSEYQQSIVAEAKAWVQNVVVTDTVLESVLTAVCWSLVGTDSAMVLELTEPPFPQNGLTLLARLRNGCAESGARYFEGLGVAGWGSKYVLLDRVLEQAKQEHQEDLIAGLKELLTSPAATDRQRTGALTLAATLASPEMEDAVAKCWVLAADKVQVLPEAILASIHCSVEPAKLLDPLMEVWAALPNEEDSGRRPQRQVVSFELKFALARGAPANVINYFANQYEVCEALRFPIATMLERTNSPDAVQLVVRAAADIARSTAGTDRWPIWSMMLADNWDDSRSGGHKLSAACMTRLRESWQNPRNDVYVKEVAFSLWAASAGPEHLEALREIGEGSPLFRRAVRKRAYLGDKDIVQELKPLLERDLYLFSDIHRVWCGELFGVVRRRLQEFADYIPEDFSGGLTDGDHILSTLLTLIPTHDAEALLVEFWDRLGYGRLFIQVALYVGTLRCREFAEESIQNAPNDAPLFEHVDHTFGFLDSERSKYLTKQHLDNLVPYLDRLGEHELGMCAEVSQRLGIPKWSRQYLYHRLPAHYRRRYHPSDNELLEDLDGFATNPSTRFHIEYWVENFETRHDPKDRILKLVNRFLASHPTIEGLRVAYACIQVTGTRQDLADLDKYSVEGQPDEIARIRANARFAHYRRTLN